MLKLPKAIRAFVYSNPCDMRKQFNGLSVLVREGMKRNPRSGDLYVFRNKRGDMLKILFFDMQGYCLFVKRMDRGCFHAPGGGGTSPIELDATELSQLICTVRRRGEEYPNIVKSA